MMIFIYWQESISVYRKVPRHFWVNIMERIFPKLLKTETYALAKKRKKLEFNYIYTTLSRILDLKLTS